MVELVLNLFLIALALPAYWLWQRQEHTVYSSRRISSYQCVVVLGCILMLLFPVVSATDDLHFIRPESEESSRTRRALKVASTDRGVAGNLAVPSQPMRLGSTAVVALGGFDFFFVIGSHQPRPAGRASTPCCNRPPPAAALL